MPRCKGYVFFNDITRLEGPVVVVKRALVLLFKFTEAETFSGVVVPAGGEFIDVSL